MKVKSFFSLIAIISLGVFFFSFFSCNDATSVKEDNIEGLGSQSELSQFENPYKCIGILHNMAMDSILVNGVKMADLQDFSFCFMNRHADLVFNDPSIRDRSVFDQTCESVKQSVFSCDPRTRTQDIITLDDSIDVLSFDAKLQLGKIVDLVNRHLEDSLEIVHCFQILDYNIYNHSDISDDEKCILLSISSIANASYLYNVQDYESKFEENRAALLSAGVDYDMLIEGFETGYRINRWSVLNSDVEGAVTGAIDFVLSGGLAGSTIMGPGGVVVGGATSIASGAVISSGIAIINGISERWADWW